MSYILLSFFIIVFSSCASQGPLQTSYNTIPSSNTSQTTFNKNYQYSCSSIHFSWPIKGKIVSSFGENVDNIKSKGIKIKSFDEKYVKSAAQGTIVFSSYLKGWGQTLIVKHPSNYYTVYANLASIAKKEGVPVKTGEVLGELALNKKQNGGILHFEIRKGYQPQNPLKFLR